MIWATWRQHRATLLAALGVIGLMIVVTVVNTLMLRPSREFQFRGQWGYGGYSACFDSNSAACYAEGVLSWISILSVALPVLLGVFVGVTVFDRDIQRGTHVLGLSQSVSRARWFWSKLLVVFAPIVAAATILGAALQWSRRNPFGTHYFGSTLEFPSFQSSALSMGATTAFALVLGATITLLLRRSLASMALTVVIAGAVLIALGGVARPHYATPNIDARGLDHGGTYSTSDSVRRWHTDSAYVNAAGREVTVDLDRCYNRPEFENSPEPTLEETAVEFQARSDQWWELRDEAITDCTRAQGADHYQVKYHLESRFWRFQVTEAAILLLLAGALLIPARWGLRRLRP